MSRMATQIRHLSVATLLGLFAGTAFAQSPADFINDASAKGMADIEASRLALQNSPANLQIQRDQLRIGSQSRRHTGLMNPRLESCEQLFIPLWQSHQVHIFPKITTCY